MVAAGAIADARVGLILSTNIAMLGTLAAVAHEFGGPLLQATAVASAILGSLSVVAIAIAAFPRLAGRKSGSVVFFGSIAAISREAYIKGLCTVDRQSYLEDLAAECHQVACIATAKFRWVRRALVLLICSAVPWIGSLYLAGRLSS